MRTTRRLTDAEREQRRAADRERLHEAAQQLLTSDGWQRWVHVRARGGLARLSLNNQLLVALSCPDATFVAGFKAWLALGYCVRKGETAIRIIAPMPIKDRDDDRQSDEEGQTGGWCDQNARRIVVDTDQPADARLRILIHETIHALGVGHAEYGRDRAEVIVDTAIFSPCQA
jgi:hypothetical protein